MGQIVSEFSAFASSLHRNSALWVNHLSLPCPSKGILVFINQKHHTLRWRYIVGGGRRKGWQWAQGGLLCSVTLGRSLTLSEPPGPHLHHEVVHQPPEVCDPWVTKLTGHTILLSSINVLFRIGNLEFEHPGQFKYFCWCPLRCWHFCEGRFQCPQSSRNRGGL